MANEALQSEIDRLKQKFTGADENKLDALDGMIEQAAYERLYLKRLNEQALASGLVKFDPKDSTRQRTLPVSGEIAKHAACLTNILDKLARHLAASTDEDDEGLDDYV